MTTAQPWISGKAVTYIASLGLGLTLQLALAPPAHTVGAVGSTAGPSRSTCRSLTATGLDRRVALKRTELPSLGGGSTSARGVDRRGRVVGDSTTPAGERHAFLYRTHGEDAGMVDLGQLFDTGASASWIRGRFITGDVLSDSRWGGPAFYVDLRERATPIKPLPLTWTAGIAGHWVVGNYWGSGDNIFAGAVDLTTAPRTLVEFGTLGGTWGGEGSRVYAARRDLAVGEGGLEQERHAMYFDLEARDGRMTDLGTLGGSMSGAEATDGRFVVGWSLLPGDSEVHAFLYDTTADSPFMMDLGTLDGQDTRATGISHGVVFGLAPSADGLGELPFIYDLRRSRPRIAQVPTPTTSPFPFGRVLGVYRRVVIGVTFHPGDGDHLFAYDLRAQQPESVDLGPVTASVMAGRYLVGAENLYRISVACASR